MLSPSNILVRVLYCLCLFMAGLALYRGLHNFALLLGSPKSLNIMNFMVAIVPNAATAVLFLFVVARFFGVAAGKFNLSTVAQSGSIRTLRIVAICLMALSVLPWLASLAGALSYRGPDSVGFALLLGSLGGGSSLGLLLFEGSRLLEREILLEARVKS